MRRLRSGLYEYRGGTVFRVSPDAGDHQAGRRAAWFIVYPCCGTPDDSVPTLKMAREWIDAYLDRYPLREA